jgi:NAD(P)-dependent dehydrogenase (short-subunit alcohol dehydrogenase family)
MPLNDRTALVTGSTSGLGAAIAKALAAVGAKVVIAGRDAERGAGVVEEIRSAGGSAVFAQHDLRDADAARKVAEVAAQEFGDVEILVNNAGTFFFGPFEAITPEEFDATMEINVRGTMLMTQAVIGPMVARGWGRVVFMSSVSAEQTFSHAVLYSTGKAALNGLMRGLVAEYAQHGITFNSVLPGLVPTPLTSPMLGEQYQREYFGGYHANKRVGTPEEIAHVVRMLVDEDAGHLIGQTIGVDGGITTLLPYEALPPPPDLY